jgi:hypothetical protein
MKSYLKAPKEERNGFKDKERLANIHSLPCVVCFTKGLEQKTKTIAHHSIGGGLGLKVSDRKTCALCDWHHTRGGKGEAIHETPLHEWESKFWTQEELIELTNKMLESA